MPTLEQGNSLGQVAEIIHAAVLLGPAAWGREPMPEAHMAADIEVFGEIRKRVERVDRAKKPGK